SFPATFMVYTDSHDENGQGGEKKPETPQGQDNASPPRPATPPKAQPGDPQPGPQDDTTAPPPADDAWFDPTTSYFLDQETPQPVRAAVPVAEPAGPADPVGAALALAFVLGGGWHAECATRRRRWRR